MNKKQKVLIVCGILYTVAVVVLAIIAPPIITDFPEISNILIAIFGILTMYFCLRMVLKKHETKK